MNTQMTRRISLLVAAMMAGLLPAAAPAAVPAPKERPGKYQLLNSRSIFSKTRLMGGGRTMGAEPQMERPPAVFTPVFVGVLYDNTEWVAYLEDPRGGNNAVIQVRAGDTLPQNNGKVEQITLEYMLVRSSSGQIFRIDMGRAINGGMRPTQDELETAERTVGTLTKPAEATGASAGAGSDNPDDPVARLRRRRQQELQGGQAQ